VADPDGNDVGLMSPELSDMGEHYEARP